MYSKILNPESGRWVNIQGRIGKKVLKNYITVLIGGNKQKAHDEIYEEMRMLGLEPETIDLLAAEKKHELNTKDVSSDNLKTIHSYKNCYNIRNSELRRECKERKIFNTKNPVNTIPKKVRRFSPLKLFTH